MSRYPRKILVINKGHPEIVKLKDPVQELAHTLKHGEGVLVDDNFELPAEHQAEDVKTEE